LIYLFVGGGGRLISRGGVNHPVKSLFHALEKGGRITLAGFPVNAANKSGIAIQCGTGKPAFISSKDTVLTGPDPTSTACRFRFPPHEKTGIWVRAGRYCDLEGPARSALRCKFCQLKAELVQGAQLLLPAKSQFPQAMSAQETAEARQPRPPADFWPLKLILIDSPPVPSSINS
jgi:hypothetical protein